MTQRKWERVLEECRAQSQPFGGRPPTPEQLLAVLVSLNRSNVLSTKDRRFLQHLVMQASCDIEAKPERDPGRPGAWTTWLAADIVRQLKERYGVNDGEAARAVVGYAPGIELTDDEIADAEKISRACRKIGKTPCKTSFKIFVFEDNPLFVQAAARLEKSIKAKRKQ